MRREKKGTLAHLEVLLLASMLDALGEDTSKEVGGNFRFIVVVHEQAKAALVLSEDLLVPGSSGGSDGRRPQFDGVNVVRVGVLEPCSKKINEFSIDEDEKSKRAART